MYNLYIINDYETSLTNGIGRYVQELIFCLKEEMSINICLVDFNTPEEHFCIKYETNIKRMLFPSMTYRNYHQYNQMINTFFRLYITDCIQNIFLFNHTPFSQLIHLLKDSHPLSKIYFTIHDLSWTSILRGNSEILKAIICNTGYKDVSGNYKSLISSIEQEAKIFNSVDKVICLCLDTKVILEEVYNINASKIYLIANGLRNKVQEDERDKKLLSRKELFIKDHYCCV